MYVKALRVVSLKHTCRHDFAATIISTSSTNATVNTVKKPLSFVTNKRQYAFLVEKTGVDKRNQKQMKKNLLGLRFSISRNLLGLLILPLENLRDLIPSLAGELLGFRSLLLGDSGELLQVGSLLKELLKR